MSTFTANPLTLGDGYDVSSDFPAEPAGWGQPGIRHAENIGHGVWMAEHPDDAHVPDDELIAGIQAASSDISAALANVRKVFGTEAMCPIHDCVRLDHPVWEMCEDAVGHTWFQGEPHDATKETNR